MNTYRFCYGAYRSDSNVDEIVRDYSVASYPATAIWFGENAYEVTHEFKAKDDEDAKRQMKEIKRLSFSDDFFVFSLYQGEPTDRTPVRLVCTEEDEE